jgi:endonuclease-3
MLSSQTKDPVCHAAVKKLRGALGGSITVPAILAADEETISGAIKQVGFHNKKTG